MVDSVLSQFPALAVCSKSVQYDRSTAYVSELLRLFESDQIDFGLSEVDAALATLLTRFNADDLREQIQDLFCSDATRSQAKWDKACSELHAFAHFERRGLLYSLGWPSGYGAAPFDFRLRVSGQLVLCDAKSASGSGLDLVHRKIEKAVKEWAERYSLTVPQIFVDYRGTITQQAVGPKLTAAIAQFAAELEAHRDLPPAPLKLTLGGSRIQVTLASSQSQRVSGGVQGVDGLIASLVPTVTEHVVGKAELSSANGSIPFALVYVHLPGSGASDVKSRFILPTVFAEVDRAQHANQNVDSLWLGGIVLDHRQAGAPTLTCCLRKRATWPRELTPLQFATSAGGTFTAL